MRKARILVVDDEQNARAALRTLLSEEGYEITEAQDGEEGLSKLQDIAPDVVLADVRMPRMDGLTLLRKSKELGSDATFLMMTAFASIEAAVEAMKAGAENYLVKPLDVRAVLVFLQKALEKRRLVQEAEMLRERVRDRFRLEGMVGDAPELRAVYEDVELRYLTGGRADVVRELHYRMAPESMFHDVMQALEQEYPDVSLGSYPQTETRELILRASGPDAQHVEAVIKAIRERITQYAPAG